MTKHWFDKAHWDLQLQQQWQLYLQKGQEHAAGLKQVAQLCAWLQPLQWALVSSDTYAYKTMQALRGSPIALEALSQVAPERFDQWFHPQSLYQQMTVVGYSYGTGKTNTNPVYELLSESQYRQWFQSVRVQELIGKTSKKPSAKTLCGWWCHEQLGVKVQAHLCDVLKSPLMQMAQKVLKQGSVKCDDWVQEIPGLMIGNKEQKMQYEKSLYGCALILMVGVSSCTKGALPLDDFSPMLEALSAYEQRFLSVSADMSRQGAKSNIYVDLLGVALEHDNRAVLAWLLKKKPQLWQYLQWGKSEQGRSTTVSSLSPWIKKVSQEQTQAQCITMHHQETVRWGRSKMQLNIKVPKHFCGALGEKEHQGLMYQWLMLGLSHRGGLFNDEPKVWSNELQKLLNKRVFWNGKDGVLPWLIINGKSECLDYILSVSKEHVEQLKEIQILEKSTQTVLAGYQNVQGVWDVFERKTSDSGLAQRWAFDNVVTGWQRWALNVYEQESHSEVKASEGVQEQECAHSTDALRVVRVDRMAEHWELPKCKMVSKKTYKRLQCVVQLVQNKVQAPQVRAMLNIKEYKKEGYQFLVGIQSYNKTHPILYWMEQCIDPKVVAVLCKHVQMPIDILMNHLKYGHEKSFVYYQRAENLSILEHTQLHMQLPVEGGKPSVRQGGIRL